MSQVTQSAARSATQLFNAVTTVADSLSNGVQSVGNAFAVANAHSAEWLARTQLDICAKEIDRVSYVKETVALSMGQRIIEREKLLAANPALRIAYDDAYARVHAHLVSKGLTK